MLINTLNVGLNLDRKWRTLKSHVAAVKLKSVIDGKTSVLSDTSNNIRNDLEINSDLCRNTEITQPAWGGGDIDNETNGGNG